MAIRHKKVSTVPDIGDPNLVQPSDWNDEHDVVDGALTIEKTAQLREELDARPELVEIEIELNTLNIDGGNF